MEGWNDDEHGQLPVLVSPCCHLDRAQDQCYIFACYANTDSSRHVNKVNMSRASSILNSGLHWEA